MAILYIGPQKRPDFSTDYYLSPLLAPSELLAALPPVYMICGEKDPLVDDVVLFAGKVRQARKKHNRNDYCFEVEEEGEKHQVRLKLIKGISHGFLAMTSLLPEAIGAVACCAGWFEEIFEHEDEKRRLLAEKREEEWEERWGKRVGMKETDIMSRRRRQLIRMLQQEHDDEDEGHLTN